LKWVSGEDKITNFTLPSTQHNKSFCSICGSALPNIQMGFELASFMIIISGNHLKLKKGRHPWLILLFLKSFPTMSDPGAISLPGVLKNWKKNIRSV
jgi:hypothetical protein